MPNTSFVQISCEPAPDIQVGRRVVSGLLISDDDARYLRSLDDTDIVVSLVCQGRRVVHTPLMLLLHRMVKSPFTDDWYISSTAVGALFAK